MKNILLATPRKVNITHNSYLTKFQIELSMKLDKTFLPRIWLQHRTWWKFKYHRDLQSNWNLIVKWILNKRVFVIETELFEVFSCLMYFLLWPTCFYSQARKTNESTAWRGNSEQCGNSVFCYKDTSSGIWGMSDNYLILAWVGKWFTIIWNWYVGLLLMVSL